MNDKRPAKKARLDWRNMVLMIREDRYFFVGPFETAAAASRWGSAPANNPADDPRWQVVRVPPGPLAPAIINPSPRGRKLAPHEVWPPASDYLIIWGEGGVRLVGPFSSEGKAVAWASDPRHNPWGNACWKTIFLASPGREPARLTPAEASARAQAESSRRARARARPANTASGPAMSIADRREKARGEIGKAPAGARRPSPPISI